MEKIQPRDLDLDASLEKINKFLDLCEKEASKRETAKNNINSKLTMDDMVRNAVQSLGVISAALEKNRHELIKAECIDLVYCAILLYTKANSLITNN